MTSQSPPILPDAVDPGDKQRAFELYRLRSEEFERNFFSLRTIEWQIAFQIYAGYAAVATAFFGLRGTAGFGMAPVTLAALSILALLLLAAVGFFCQFQTQRRLHFTRSMQNAYLSYLHNVSEPELDIPKGVIKPRFGQWWAFWPLQLLNAATAVAITVSILYSTTFCKCV